MKGKNIPWRTKVNSLAVRIVKKYPQDIRNKMRRVESRLLLLLKPASRLAFKHRNRKSEFTKTQVPFDELNQAKVTEVMLKRARSILVKLVNHPQEQLRKWLSHDKPTNFRAAEKDIKVM